MRKIMNITKYLSIAGMLTLSACSSTIVEYNNVVAKPTVTETSMASVMNCSAKFLKNYESNVAYVLLVRDVVDGTIRKVSSLDGPLADAGAYQLKSSLNALMPTENGLVIDQYPLMFKTFYGRSRSDNFGTPSKQNLQLYREQMLRVINARRSRKGLKPVNTLALIALDGSFTRLDGSPFGSHGFGLNGGYEKNNNQSRSADIELGRSESAKVVSLLMNIIRPDMNLVVRSQSLDLNFRNNTNRFNLKTQYDSGKLGWSFNKSKIESLHSAQQTLIDASALWVMAELFKDSGLQENCFPDENIGTKPSLEIAKTNHNEPTQRIATGAIQSMHPEVRLPSPQPDKPEASDLINKTTESNAVENELDI